MTALNGLVKRPGAWACIFYPRSAGGPSLQATLACGRQTWDVALMPHHVFTPQTLYDRAISP